ncbi:unnamed protein product [Moneuplotes crassus]|uniref:Uncharacterized protein n=1 Tax=Euplotes crassus TaxID=5936 RepID=A0AAD1XG34_EUPCR|nr:unnamed protein product [Moneuplotes crassus]
MRDKENCDRSMNTQKEEGKRKTKLISLHPGKIPRRKYQARDSFKGIHENERIRDITISQSENQNSEILNQRHKNIDNSYCGISRDSELLRSELQTIKEQLELSNITHHAASQKWKAQERNYMSLIDSIKSQDEWDGIYQTLIHKVENLKDDIENIKID